MIAIVQNKNQKKIDYRPNYNIRDDKPEANRLFFQKAIKLIECSSIKSIILEYCELKGCSFLRKEYTSDSSDSYEYFYYTKDSPIDVVFDDNIDEILKVTLYTQELDFAKERLEQENSEKLTANLSKVSEFYSALSSIKSAAQSIKEASENESVFEIDVDQIKSKIVTSIINMALEKIRNVMGMGTCFAKRELLGYVTLYDGGLQLQASEESAIKEFLSPSSESIKTLFIKRSKNTKYASMELPHEERFYFIYDANSKLSKESELLLEIMLAYLGSVLAIHKMEF